jgi:hypothetical protein
LIIGNKTVDGEDAESKFAAAAVAATRLWLQKAVIGLELCPFAAAVYANERIRYSVSDQHSAVGLREDLSAELQFLHDTDAQQCETTLLIHPRALQEFSDYNEFLSEADAAVAEMGFEGELQIASFHPAYQFHGTAPQAVENCTNRSPYPMLHLLREASIERAVATYPGVDEIYSRNLRTLRRLGTAGWQRLWEKE